MRRVSSAAAAGAAALWLTAGATSGQQSNRAPVVAMPATVQATRVAEVRTWDRFVTDGARAGSLRLRSVQRDPALPARTVERFEQVHQGVPVWGADMVRDSERGVPISIFGALSPDLDLIDLSVEPALTPAAARDAMVRTGGALLAAPALVIVRLDTGEHRLAYTGSISVRRGIHRVFVDARTGAELMRYSEIQTQVAVGSGTGVLGDQKKLSVENSAGTFVAFDRHRPPVIQTFDLRGDLARAKALLFGERPYLASDLASDADNVWSDVAVVDAHVHVSWTYDYYFKRFGRSGLDGRNGPIDIVVNAVTQAGGLAVDEDDLDFVLNAFFSPVGGPSGRGVMFFGNGIPPTHTADGRTWTYLSGGLDIAAHELTHAVTDATSGLVYRNESGALNEAFSDIMGKSVEFFYHPPGGGLGQADYVIGKDVIRAGGPGSRSGIRSMANPAVYGDPDHYARRYIGIEDGGGVHTNSGIVNHAFYLAVEGGTHRTSGMVVQGVGPANREQIEKVFYRAFTLLLPRHATFLVARSATAQAARDLYGAGGAVERAVTQAWNAVGVPDPASVTSMSASVSAGGVTTYVVTMGATGRYEATLAWPSPEAVDLDLYLTPAGCAFAQESCVLTQSISPDAVESLGWSVRAGETYWLSVHKYAGSATTFTIQHWISGISGLTATPARVEIEGPPLGGLGTGRRK